MAIIDSPVPLGNAATATGAVGHRIKSYQPPPAWMLEHLEQEQRAHRRPQPERPASGLLKHRPTDDAGHAERAGECIDDESVWVDRDWGHHHGCLDYGGS
jgi:hypothetical protein